MKTLLQNKTLRKNFLLLIGTLLILIIIIRAFILPSFEPTLQQSANQILVTVKDPIWLAIVTRLMDSLFVSLTVTVGIGLFLFHIELPDDEKKFEIIEPFKIGEVFQKERAETKIWYFSGGTGRFTRLVTIPELSKISKNTNSHKTIKLQIIDPNDKTVCKNYANYKNSLKSIVTEQKWTAHSVKLESIATIISAVIQKTNNPLLDITICLKNSFSTLRIDLSSTVAVLTKEERLEPALVCRPNSFLYRTYEEEILQTFKEYPQLNMAIKFNLDNPELSIKDITEITTKLEIQNDLSEEDNKMILSKLRDNNNPYA